LGISGVNTTRPYYHESDSKRYCHVAKPGTMEQTTWSTLDGCHVEEDDVIEAVRDVTGDNPSSSMSVGGRFTDKRGYDSMPPRQSRSRH